MITLAFTGHTTSSDLIYYTHENTPLLTKIIAVKEIKKNL
jgi:hypothetical protein